MTRKLSLSCPSYIIKLHGVKWECDTEENDDPGATGNCKSMYVYCMYIYVYILQISS